MFENVKSMRFLMEIPLGTRNVQSCLRCHLKSDGTKANSVLSALQFIHTEMWLKLVVKICLFW